MAHPESEVLSLACRLLPGASLLRATPCAGGRNSRVYRLDMAGGVSHILKRYPRRQDDPRDRLGTEWRALRFLREHGLRRVPEPIAMDARAGAAIYSFIPGQTPAPVEAALEAAAPMRDFAVALWPLRQAALAAGMPPASEACFTVEAIGAQVERRCARITDACAAHAARQGSAIAELCRTVGGLMADRVLPEARQALRAAGERLDLREPLPEDQRIPSPSDFGFHNAVRAASGDVHFIDFEYFGMDDPAKLLADVCWHPGMSLSRAQRRWFMEQILLKIGQEADAPRLAERLDGVLPLWRCKWVCILFNCLLAREVPAPLLTEQLTRARALLECDVPRFA